MFLLHDSGLLGDFLRVEALELNRDGVCHGSQKGQVDRRVDFSGAFRPEAEKGNERGPVFGWVAGRLRQSSPDGIEQNSSGVLFHNAVTLV